MNTQAQPTRRPAAELLAAAAAMDATFHAARQSHAIACNAWDAHKANAMAYVDACAVQELSDVAHEAYRHAVEQWRTQKDTPEYVDTSAATRDRI